MTPKIPTWIMVWTFLMMLLPLGFSILGYVDPASHDHFSEEAVAEGAAMYGGPIGLYIARNMASFIVTALAWAKRSAPMIIVVSLLRASTDVFDVIHDTIAGTVGGQLLFFAALEIAVSGLVIYKLWNWPVTLDSNEDIVG